MKILSAEEGRKMLAAFQPVIDAADAFEASGHNQQDFSAIIALVSVRQHGDWIRHNIAFHEQAEAKAKAAAQTQETAPEGAEP